MNNIEIKLTHVRSFSPSVYLSLLYLNQYYPGFSEWYSKTFVASLEKGEGSILLAKDKLGKLAGCALLKHSDEENKLRCLRVDPNYTNSGLGIQLIDKSLEVLEDDKPIVTVCEEMINLYSRPFINRYGFDIVHVSKGIYRPKKLEYHFNGK